MQNMQSKLSIFILGTTAVGKTKLSIQIAKHFNGSIISTDSKQLYRHANLLTAKSTKQEQLQAKHFMIDAIDLHESSYNRNKFYNMAKSACNNIWLKQNASIFVGGTNYYVQPLLFKLQGMSSLLESEQVDKQKRNKLNNNNELKQKMQQIVKDQKYLKKIEQFKNKSLPEKYDLLCEVDDVLGQKIHRNDQFRINSFLQRYYETGQKPSDSYKSYSYDLNNPNTIVFWIRNSDKKQHQSTVSKRINKMMQKEGLIQILSIFTYLHNYYFNNQQTTQKEITQSDQSQFSRLKKKLIDIGIGQSIGYKQFFPFFFNLKNGLLSKEFDIKDNQRLNQIRNIFINKINDYEQIYATFLRCFQTLRQSQFYDQKLIQKQTQQLIKDTMNYCKKQITWIRNRIFQMNQKAIKRFYILELKQNQNQSLQERFQKQIKLKAIQILQSMNKYGQQQTFQQFQTNKNDFQNSKKQKCLEQWKKYNCEPCKVEVSGICQWEQHITSKRHKNIDKIKQKIAQIQKWKQIKIQKTKLQCKDKQKDIQENQKQEQT